MASWTIIIPRWRPATANELLSRHWGKRHKLKRSDGDFVAVYARNAGVPRATGRRRVSVKVVMPSGRGRPLDPDAVLKSLLDALVNAGLLVDDSQRYCECAMPEIIRGDHDRTEIVIEELE